MKGRVEKLLPRDLRSEKQLYMSGRKDVRKREIFSQKSLEAWAITIKLTTGMHLPNLQMNKVAKLSQRWLGFGAILVDKQFIEHLKYRIYKKKKIYGYKERNEEKRAQFANVIATKEPKELVYIDESGIDNTEDYPYGYCQKGQRFYALKSGKKTQRISMVQP